jgi:hypothetical protein
MAFLMSASTTMSQGQVLAVKLSPVVLALLVSALAWGVLFVCFPPNQQDFPLNDDWAFARGALMFARGEGIHYSNWASMPQLGQWLWACPFLWLLGPSFFALRLSTIVLSWLGLWAFYDLLRQEGWTSGRAALTAAVLAFHPLFFLLQGTFMTDVPALSLSLIALALYGQALRRERTAWLTAACLTAALAAISRQNTVTVPLVAAVLLWRVPSLRLRPLWWLGILLPVAAGMATHFWFQQRTDIRAMKPDLLAPAPLLQLPFVMLHFAGLAALPLLLLAPRIESWERFAWALAVMLAFAGYWYLYGVYLPYGGLFPYTDNMLTPHGAFAGPRLSGGLLVVGERSVVIGIAGRVALTLLGCVAGAMLVMRGLYNWHPVKKFSPLLLFTLLQLPFLLIIPGIYDRYLLFFLPGALFLAAPPREEASEPVQGWRLLSSFAALLLVGMVSLALMHDWLAWNAARWQLGRRALQQRHINPRHIEGGVEWDGWYTAVAEKPERPSPLRWPVLPFTREWFPSITGRYCLSFSPLKGARRVDAQPYTLWLYPRPCQFYLLELPPLADKPLQHPTAR